MSDRHSISQFGSPERQSSENHGDGGDTRQKQNCPSHGVQIDGSSDGATHPTWEHSGGRSHGVTEHWMRVLSSGGDWEVQAASSETMTIFFT